MLVLGLTLAFLSELGALLGIALLAASWTAGPWRIPAALLAVALVAVAWGLWAAPRASHRLAGHALLLFKLAVFSLGAWGFLRIGRPVPAGLLLAAAALGLALG